MTESSHSRKFALITGAAKRVGREIALHLAQIGYDIGVHYNRSADAASKTADEIRKLGVNAALYQADLRSPDEIIGMFSQVDNLNLLVNSAGIMPRSNLLKINVADWDNMMNSNLRQVWLCCREAAQKMKPGGLVINLSDIGAQKNWTGYGAYVISKNGVETITRLFAKQLAPEIRVCGIAPGLLMKSDDMSQEEWNSLVKKSPLEHETSLQTLFNSIDLLISNEYITGEIITLDGGLHLQ